MKITLAQLNPTIGDIEGNYKKVVSTVSKYGDNTDLIIFPELFIIGYPPRDILERPWVIEKIQKVVTKILIFSKEYPETGIILGVPLPTNKSVGHKLYNSAVFIYNGKIFFTQHKSLLPTYDVFDETRYFDPSPEVKILRFKTENIGLTVCEDVWNDPGVSKTNIRYSLNPINELYKKGATVFVNISASPFYIGKEKIRFELISKQAKKYNAMFVYINQVGGNDELVFDGRSMVVDKTGNLTKIFPSFKEHVETVDTKFVSASIEYVPENTVESLYNALVLGIRDYVTKCGFKKIAIGLSGGIDSAVTCCLAAAAVGKENVLGITMPSIYSSKGSVKDSRELAKNLGIEFRVVTIKEIYKSYLTTFGKQFKGTKRDITEENIQARIRGNILMSFSNKFGYLVLSTGNKSELAVGYCTLYGDMSGGLAAISDVPKTMVYKLAGYINSKEKIIPHNIFDKPPSAELKPNQTDQDTLPPYDVLDKILYYYVDEGYSYQEIVKKKFNPETVRWVIKTVDKNEFKRRQSAPGLKVTTKAFGTGRRMMIAAKYEV